MRERTFARGLTVGVVVLLGVAAGCGGNGKKPVDIARADGGDAAGMGGDAGGGGSREAGGTTAPVSEECARQACNAGVSDLCCPSSCSAATDIDCAGCGNGRLEAGELCDPAGSCPQACAQLKCQMQQLKSGGTCAAVCVPGGMQTACVDGDECCPAGCTAVNDRDCTGQCGNGTLEPGELCDPLTTCPQTCPMQGCTLMALVEAGTCLARCMEAGQETQCRAQMVDGCCPSGCNAANDSDCAVVCGNGTLEGRETCDPLASCPGACPAMGCRLRQLVNGGSCTAVCIDAGLQTTCQSGDGCCPVSCNNTNDTDCPALCGNSVVESGETCDPIATCMDRERACVSDAATTRTRVGDPGRCTFTCMETTRTCGPADGACPPGCGPIQDRDCPGCGNGVMEANETCDPVTVCLERQRTCISDQSTLRTPGGDPAACTFTCVETPRPCGPVDSNCPAGCTPTRDADCAGCGNGMLDPGETCDPVSVCEQRAQACVSDASTIRTPMGDPDTCRFTCQETPRMCGPVDSFCPPNCGPTQDRDCAGCGNGRVESGETCDPCRAEDVRACVGDVNTIRTPRGSAEACTFACDVMPRPCQNGDSFCPSRCTRMNDTDCPAGPGDMCGTGIPCGAGSCVDGRCCVQTCAVCQSCTGAGGTCVAILDGQQDNVPAGACVAPARCNGQGSCVTPACEVTVQPLAHDFESVAVGSASPVFTFVVGSTCANTVTLGLGNPREFMIESNGCTGGVAPGAPCRVGMVFRPVAGGRREGRLNVVPAMGQATSLSLTGTGLIAQLVWKPDTVQFGRVPVGDQRVEERITLTNVGTAPTAPIQFPPQPPFSVYKTSCQALAPNQSCDVVVQFAPEQGGQFMASLQALGGNGVTAALQVQGTGFERPPLTIEPSSHGFGSVFVGTRSNPAPFTVHAGIALIGVVARTTSSEFVIVDNGCTGTLAAGATCSIMVVFAPTVAGLKEGVLLQVSGRENIIIRQPTTHSASSSLTGNGRLRILEPPPRPDPGPVVQSNLPCLACDCPGMRTWTRSFVLALAAGGAAAFFTCSPTVPEPSGTGGAGQATGGAGGRTNPATGGSAGQAPTTGGSGGQATGGTGGQGNGGTGGQANGGTGGQASATGGSGGQPSGTGGSSAPQADASPGADGNSSSTDGSGAPGGAARPSAGCGKPNPAVGKRMITTGGKNQSYWVALPLGYDPAKPYPLGFAFHGFGLDDKTCHDGSECPGFRTDVGAKAITVFPKSISAGWEYPVVYLPQNVKYVEDLIALMKSEYCVDEGRIFVSGVSSGGHFTHHLSCQLGDKLWAAIPIAAYLEPAAMMNCKGFPAQIHIRGITDSLKKGQTARDFQAMRNGCSTIPAGMEAMEKEVLDAFTMKLKPPKTRCLSYEGCTMNQLRYCVFSQVTYNGGTHGWPDDGGKLIAEFLGTLR